MPVRFVDNGYECDTKEEGGYMQYLMYDRSTPEAMTFMEWRAEHRAKLEVFARTYFKIGDDGICPICHQQTRKDKKDG